MAELLEQFEAEIERFTLIPSDGGRFELKVNGRLLYSKLSTSRHMEAGEATGIIRKFLKEGS
jgi:selenoprotein W-related protein